jgi:hypothetical protein
MDALTLNTSSSSQQNGINNENKPDDVLSPRTPLSAKALMESTSNALITRKVQSTIGVASNLRENEPLRTALQYVGTFYQSSENTQQRQDLQGELEKKALETHEMLLGEFLKVNDQLQLLDTIVSELNNTCNIIDQRLQRNREHSRQFLSKIKSLNNSIQETEQRQIQLRQFLEQFQLTEEEKIIIMSGKVDATFFAILKKVHDIHTRCTEMLRNDQQKASIEILDEMSAHQDMAYERLSRWTQQQCKYLSGTESHSINSFYDSDDNLITDPDEMELIVEGELRQAFDALVERPALLKCCTDQFTEDRSSALVKRFFEALTKGANRGASKPIEMQAHDPIRYIGDILAWIHQSTAAEVELVHAILGISGKVDAPSEMTNKRSSLDRRNMDSKSKLSFDILDKIFNSLISHLKMRVQQVLVSSNKETLVVYFRLAHLLELYSFTLGKMLGEKSTLPVYLMELKNQSMQKFFHVLEKNVASIIEAELQVPDDLTPSEAIKDMMEKLNEIMSTYSKSVVPEDRREEDFSQVLSSVIDPLLQKLADYFNKKKDLVEYQSDVHVFLINCYFLIQNSLGNYSFTTKKVEQVANLMDRHVELFVSHQSDTLLSKCGLKEKILLIKSNTGTGVPLSQITGLTREDLSKFCVEFYENLFSLGSQLLIPQRQCYQISSARLRVYTQNRIAADLSSAYTLLYQTIHDSSNQYERPEEFAYHSPQQVITLLEY